mmetsp:Transcript_299/g.727  ORF Transcript_299/g.727 Transcript_299/m.727 type:complete len:703 (+) Transcript_299:36-2144(+)|eukprot:CAMPEP_0197189154 /NCGR_PEP_ID=MMETSP1423-20130617/19253_1 /TAXON_ID=476441 /ORGANISM="Pseudo-nitzschia heimii, Strain UNC1101" /LENGTH=702 /DNA_ID=CAMNT_0042641193 /DNA_START=30 /DNA_END=2138 /DNA_ORIENTATION=-
MVGRNEEGETKHHHDGIWIGIDLGTSNSACAVWDSSRGGSKWVRLLDVTDPTGVKAGRIMPSVVRFKSSNDDPLIGFPALPVSLDGVSKKNRGSLLRSVKRLLGKRLEDLDVSWVESLDYDVQNPSENNRRNGVDDNGSLRLVVRTDSLAHDIEVTPEQVLAIELKAIRKTCQAYLDRYRCSKNLRVPGEGKGCTRVDNVVVGVPAHYSQRHIALMKEACREAGFHGYVGTCLESTAAAIAYGLTLQERSKKSTKSSMQQRSREVRNGGQIIMVIDMGGGTCDITIIEKIVDPKNLRSPKGDNYDNPSSSYRVLVTKGDDQLGGDDIDQAIIEYCFNQVLQRRGRYQNNQKMSSARSDSLKVACQKAKEHLCRLEDPSACETVSVDYYYGDSSSNAESQDIMVTNEILNTTILQPWLRRARDLILKARSALDENTSTTGVAIDEVVLVGGTTRIPAIRRMIESIFPEIELSSSLNPMSSVAQGLAIQAAITSKQIPMHELKSAMMLDCVPHAIGVLLSCADRTQNRGFVEVIPRNTLLPAMGSATFVLANKHQAGVTIQAVEEVGLDNYEPMSKEDFSFVLRRFSKAKLENISERTIQVGMKLDSNGRFIVSVFDENDPEQVRKKERFERIKNGEVVGELDYIKDMMQAESDEFTNEQVTLAIALMSLFVLYVAIKISFTDPLENGSSIFGRENEYRYENGN